MVVVDWLVRAMDDYNRVSLEKKESYVATLHMPGTILDELVNWCFQSLPDEILVGLEVDISTPHRDEVDELFQGADHHYGLFAGQGSIIGEAHIVNRGDSYSVHHLPEEWTDGLFTESRGARGGRFTHWLHTHPNAPAIPSGADADAAQATEGVDLILGVDFSPAGPLPWYDDVEGERRPLAKDEQKGEPEAENADANRPRWRSRLFGRRDRRQVLGKAPTGHSIHGLELIAFHRSGVGINVIFVDGEGLPYGWPFKADTT
jgi:hypothetical protein